MSAYRAPGLDVERRSVDLWRSVVAQIRMPDDLDPADGERSLWTAAPAHQAGAGSSAESGAASTAMRRAATRSR